jgi:hypothetical protein
MSVNRAGFFNRIRSKVTAIVIIDPECREVGIRIQKAMKTATCHQSGTLLGVPGDFCFGKNIK